MRVEETSYTKAAWKGELPWTGGGAKYRLEAMGATVSISIHSGGLYVGAMCHSLPHLLNFYRDLGGVLDELQPGLVNPLPDGDLSEVDAMKVIYEADRIQRGAK